MARRKNSLQPAEMTLNFNVNWDGPATTKTIDISQCVSLMNRRYYSQQMNWYVSEIKICGLNGATGNIVGAKLMNTWVVKNSLIKAKAIWNKAIDNAIDESSTEARGKFLDFKVYMNAQHHQDGFDENLIPEGYTAGQWDPATTRIPTQSGQGVASSTEREFIVTGDNLPGTGASGLDALSIIQGYAASRALPHESDPETPPDMDTNWMVKMFDQPSEQNQDIIEDLQAAGTQPPYPYSGDGTNTDTMYPGGANVSPNGHIFDITNLTGNSLTNTTYLKGGQFPCGLLQLGLGQFPDQAGNSLQIFVTLSPGKARGYLAEPIEEM